jgi:hypothetical protein
MPPMLDDGREDRRKVFVNAKGEPVKLAKKTKRGSKGKIKRTMIEPVKQKISEKKRRSAKSRREAHEAKLRRRQAAKSEVVVPEVDAALAKEIEAIKADDVRKGRYYNRRKDI